MWLGTLSGLYIFNVKKKQVRKILTSGNLFSYKLFKDKDDNLWVASESGLYRSKIIRNGKVDCGQFEKECAIRDVHDITQNKDYLIVAARSGLYLRDSSGEWEHYDHNSGFSTDFMNGVEVDLSGALWVGTEYGLNSFIPSTGAISRYYRGDGIETDYYTKNAHCSASDGSLYFGGIGGLVRIQPFTKNVSKESSDPRITDIIINGTRRSFKNDVLNHKDNSISFKFAVTNYSSRQKNLFRYRLWGVDDSWKMTDNPYSDTYASLRPGKYRLELHSYNVLGKESENSASFSFVIRPPWWANIIANIIYCLLGAIAWGFIVWRVYTVYKNKKPEVIGVAPEDADFILKAVCAMQNHMSDETYGVEQLAGELCMSKSNLYLKIRKLTGKSSLQFIHKIRMDKACALLRETQLPISDIAHETGFGSTAYFCTCFKHEKGISPGQWRKTRS